MAVVLAATGVAAAEVGDPLPGLAPAELARFTAGRDAFVEVEDVADGLGPVFNGDACATCHDGGAVGGGSTRVETRFGTITNGAFDPMSGHGGSLIQDHGIGVQGACTFAPEEVPAAATITAGRRTTPLFGLGLVDAVPDAGFRALAIREALRTPATAGRPNVVVDATTGKRRVGRFGWKSQVPSLFHFAGDAYLNEMGITSPFFPSENCPQGDCTLLACDPVPDPEDDGEDVVLFRDFMTFLAAPPRLVSTSAALRFRGHRGGRRKPSGGDGGGSSAGGVAPSPTDLLAGSRLFDRIGCADCHVRTLATGRSPVHALDRKTFQPFSDFLLHDMGTLGDGIEQGLATGRDMRTAPLWGLHLVQTFLHDGTATTIADAILAHDGQGQGARARFVALTPTRQAQLVAFLGTL
jgi:CxxC motif-containing protein (DUF1111 family)